MFFNKLFLHTFLILFMIECIKFYKLTMFMRAFLNGLMLVFVNLTWKFSLACYVNSRCTLRTIK